MEDLQSQVTQAIKAIQAQVRWRPGSETGHLTEINDLLTAYEVDVRFPDVSGMEHLDMLLMRSALAKAERSHALTAEQVRRLAEADRILASQAGRFYQAIGRIADLAAWRQQEGAPPQEWWWYLDVLAQAPAVSQAEMVAVAA